jgi:hypothetical protein
VIPTAQGRAKHLGRERWARGDYLEISLNGAGLKWQNLDEMNGSRSLHTTNGPALRYAGNELYF